jgi:LCP family protein required for cell wall assembly
MNRPLRGNNVHDLRPSADPEPIVMRGPMTPTPEAPTAAPHGRRRWPIVLVAMSMLVAAVVAGGLSWAYRDLSGNIHTIDPSAGLGDVRPAKDNESMNILLIGSDTREGANGSVGGESPGLADTTLVLHLSAANSWATAVSIPRDSMVEMPDCDTPDGSTQTGALRQFNQAYVIGGPVCVQRTVESLTDLHIDHFVVVDFTGFQDLVDALGGITVDIAGPISDPRSHIYFDAGCQTLDGAKALDYVRVRHGVGDGSDLSRIERQHQFLTAVIQEVTSKGVLLNPVSLYHVLDAATSSVTTDTGIGSIQDMAGIAVRARTVGLGNIHFMTVPVETWPQDPNRVQWQEPAAGQVWDNLASDTPVVPVKPSPSASPSASASDSDSSAIAPSASASPSITTQSADAPHCTA